MAQKSIAYINPDMLKWARSETPFSTVEEVAGYAGIDADKISAWENNSDYPSVGEAKKLAKLYKVPFACFYLSVPPEKKPKRYTDRRTNYGAAPDEISYELWSEIRRIQSNRESIIEYFIKSDDEIIKTIPTASGDASAIAKAIREHLGLATPLKTKSAFGNNPFNYYRNIIERCNIIVAQISGVSMDEMKGISISYDEFPIVAVNNKDFDTSKVFSLFHELAHIFRRTSSLCSIDLENYSDDEEAICDRIAAETLMPEKVFKEIALEQIKLARSIDTVCLGRIAGRFGVSTYATLRRLYDTGVIRSDEYFSLLEIVKEDFEKNRAYIEAMRKGKNVPVYFHVKFINQNGLLFPRTVIQAYAHGAITHGEMCKVLGIKSKHISNLEQAVMLV